MNIDGQQIKNTILNFIVPIVALGISLLLFFVVIYPGINNRPILKEELNAASTLENQLKTKLVTLNRLVDFETVVAENAGLLNRVLVSESSVPELLTQIDIIAKNSGLVVNKLSYSFGEVAEEETLLSYDVVNVSLGTLGSYEQINAFLDTLEDSARLIDVSTFRFAFENAKETTGLYNATFILISPYLNVDLSAVTDEPINVDIADPEFIEVLDVIRDFRFYDISVDTQFEDLIESTAEEIEESVEEDEVPEGEVDLGDLTEEVPAL